MNAKFVQCVLSLNPFGSIFGKELRLAARRRRTYAVRALYVLVMLCVVGFGWWSCRDLFRGQAAYIIALGQFTQRLVSFFLVFQFIALQLLSPVLTGYTVSEEIRKRTLPCLSMTPLNGFQIVLGKLLSRVIVIFLLIAAGLPFLALLRVFGGIDWNMILMAEALTLCAALFAATLALTLSTILRRPFLDPSIVTVILLIFAYAILPKVLRVIFSPYPLTAIYQDAGNYYKSLFNPFLSLMVLLEPAKPPPGSSWEWFDPLIQCVLQLAATVILVAVASVLVRRAARRAAAGEAFLRTGLRERWREFREKHLDRSLVGAAVFNPPKVRWLAACSDRPVLWRELRNAFCVYPVKRVLWIAIFLVLLTVLYVSNMTAFLSRSTHVLFLECFFLLIFTRSAFLVAGAVTREKESRTLELLLTTPLTPRQVLLDKLLGTLPRLLILICLLVFHLLLFGCAELFQPRGMLYVPILLTGPLIFLIGLGIYLSTWARDTRIAVICILGLAALLWLPAFVLNHQLAVSRPFEFWFRITNPSGLFSLTRLSLSLNPFLGLPLCLIDTGHFTRGYSTPAFLFLLLRTLLVYSAAGIILFEMAVRRFRLFVTRGNQSP